ncbi:chromosome segregation protein [Carpediemonas membranifera]|uniref:Chromosome segregation protein n=1 Tax=Carpediemonas membranifera TaxID=201153 RepID=A0A8J6AUN8_9EUKA|nr:chromosome segregation protein [Carpediemonas membranifera]|eukprot:KAG9392930.1 chromosome segregation protein [Carpediemonas membranifera]
MAQYKLLGVDDDIMKLNDELRGLSGANSSNSPTSSASLQDLDVTFVIDDKNVEAIESMPFEFSVESVENDDCGGLEVHGLRDIETQDIVYAPEPPIRAMMTSDPTAETVRIASITANWAMNGFNAVLAVFGTVQDSPVYAQDDRETLVDAIIWDLFDTASYSSGATVAASVSGLGDRGVVDFLSPTLEPSQSPSCSLDDSTTVRVDSAKECQDLIQSALGAGTDGFSPAIRLHVFRGKHHSTLDIFDATVPIGRQDRGVDGLLSALVTLADGEGDDVDFADPRVSTALTRTVIPSVMCGRSVFLVGVPSASPDETLALVQFGHIMRDLKLPVMKSEGTLPEFEEMHGAMKTIGDVLDMSGHGARAHSEPQAVLGDDSQAQSPDRAPDHGDDFSDSSSSHDSYDSSLQPDHERSHSLLEMSGEQEMREDGYHLTTTLQSDDVRRLQLDCESRVLEMADKVTTLELDVQERDLRIQRLESALRRVRAGYGHDSAGNRVHEQVRALSAKNSRLQTELTAARGGNMYQSDESLRGMVQTLQRTLRAKESDLSRATARITELMEVAKHAEGLKRRLQATEVRLANATRVLAKRDQEEVEEDLVSTARAQRTEASRTTVASKAREMAAEMDALCQAMKAAQTTVRPKTASTRGEHRGTRTQALVQCLDINSKLEPALIGNSKLQRLLRQQARVLAEVMRDDTEPAGPSKARQPQFADDNEYSPSVDETQLTMDAAGLLDRFRRDLERMAKTAEAR